MVNITGSMEGDSTEIIGRNTPDWLHTILKKILTLLKTKESYENLKKKPMKHQYHRENLENHV